MMTTESFLKPCKKRRIKTFNKALDSLCFIIEPYRSSLNVTTTTNQPDRNHTNFPPSAFHPQTRLPDRPCARQHTIEFTSPSARSQAHAQSANIISGIARSPTNCRKYIFFLSRARPGRRASHARCAKPTACAPVDKWTAHSKAEGDFICWLVAYIVPPLPACPNANVNRGVVDRVLINIYRFMTQKYGRPDSNTL